MSTLANLLSENSYNIPPVLSRKVSEAIALIDVNANEEIIVAPLRRLIMELANPMTSPLRAIQEYLEAEETQNSATRQIFEEEIEQNQNHEMAAAERSAERANSVAQFFAMFENRDYSRQS
jgi:hypothetical protein